MKRSLPAGNAMTAPSRFSFYSNVLPFLAGLVFLAANTPASAQTHIQITTSAGTPCVATTDIDGVTLVAGSTDLKATGVTFVPAGCGAASQPPAPSSTNNLTLAATATNSAAPFTYTINWNVSNATACVGTVTSGAPANVTGWGTFSGPFNGAASAPISISAPGSYALTLTCSNAGNAANLVSPTLVLSPQAGGGGTGSCSGPAGLTRVTYTDVYYGAYPANVRQGVNAQEWGALWGHFNPTDAELAWPARNGSQPTLISFRQNSYLAAHFKTGASTVPYGFFLFPFLAAPSMDMAISTTCGDFTATPSGCQATAGSSGGNLVSWTFATNNPTKCILQPNTDYWVNMKYTDPNSTSVCGGGASICPLPTALQTN